MSRRSLSRAACVAVAFPLAWLAAACVTSEPESDRPEAGEAQEAAATSEPELPWPTTFLTESVLMARRVRIEGPPGLRDHLAQLQDIDSHTHEVKTVEGGLLQKTRVRDDVEYQVPIRCQLDQLVIMAEYELVVLERPTSCAVTVQADGDAFYKQTGSQEEQRAQSLKIVGR